MRAEPCVVAGTSPRHNSQGVHHEEVRIHRHHRFRFRRGRHGIGGYGRGVHEHRGGNAGDTVTNLQKQGYSVQLNGSVSAPLSQCTVTDVHGVSAPPAGQSSAMSSTTVYVDVSCPDLNN